MIQPVKLYAATCDNCQQKWQGEVEGIALAHFDNPESLRDQVAESGWYTGRTGKIYCPECHEETDGQLTIHREREVRA